MQTFFPRLKWSDKTQIIRETQDRLVKLNTNYYLRKIDKYNEGFNPAKVQKVNETTINSAIGGKWYLVYMSNPATTQDKTGNPMFMGLLGTTSYKIANAGTGTNDITITLEDDKIYMTSRKSDAPQEELKDDSLDSLINNLTSHYKKKEDGLKKLRSLFGRSELVDSVIELISKNLQNYIAHARFLDDMFSNFDSLIEETVNSDN